MHNLLRKTIAPILGLLLAAFGITNVVLAQLQDSDLVSLIASYHAEANKIVNRRLQAVATQLQQLKNNQAERLTIQKQFIVPSPATLVSTCTSENKAASELNLSTTCLHFELKQLREGESGFLSKLATAKLVAPSNNTATINNLAQTENQLRLAQEELSKDLIEATLISYNQLVTNLILHRENEITIAQVSALQNHLEDLEATVAALPSSFHNVTTNRCQ